jgi:hypothetical protein
VYGGYRANAVKARQAAFQHAVSTEGGASPDFNPATAHAQLTTKTQALGQLEKSTNILKGYRAGLEKNFDVFLNAAKDLPDAGEVGLKIANSPLRALDEKVVGSNVITAARTAVVPAVREYIRITGSSPTLQGPIHQAAMEQAQKLLDVDNMTIPNIVTALGIMRQDLNNVEEGLVGQKDTLTKEINDLGANQPKPTATVPAGGTGATATVTMGKNGAADVTTPPKQIMVTRAQADAYKKKYGEAIDARPRADGAVYVVQ